MAIKIESLSGVVHSPTDVAHATIQWANRWQGDSGMGYAFGVDAVDDKMLPFRPGRQTIIVGRPGHGKTTLLSYVTANICKQLVTRNIENKMVIAFTWEQYVEELAATIASVPGATMGEIERGESNQHAIEQMGIKLIRMPLWMIGYSYELQDYVVKGPDNQQRKLPRLTPQVIADAVNWISEEYGIQPAAMTFDYLQEMTIDGSIEKRQQVDAAAHVTKEMALRFGAPSIVAAQARREVDDYKFKTPQLGDCQWSSVGEQISDTVLGTWMPYVSLGKGQLDVMGVQYDITPNMLVLRMNKQRGGIPRATWLLHVNHQTLAMSDYTDADDLF